MMKINGFRGDLTNTSAHTKSVWCRAGHVLGAAMFMVEIQGMRCLYTGDYSRVPDRHMPSADIPEIPPHIVIVESTFGVSNHLPREDRERMFQNKVLISVFLLADTSVRTPRNLCFTRLSTKNLLCIEVSTNFYMKEC